MATQGRTQSNVKPTLTPERQVAAVLNVTVGDAPAQLRAAVLAMKRADSTIRRDVAQRMRQTMNPVWRTETAKGADGMAARVLSSNARIAGGNPPQLIAAASRRGLGKGKRLVPDRHWAGYEYGAGDTTRPVTNRKGTRYTRHVMRHLPARGAGRVLTPGTARILPRIAAYWTQSIVRAFMDAAEGKG